MGADISYEKFAGCVKIQSRDVDKRPIRLWPGYFLTRHDDIFLDPMGKKLKICDFSSKIFQSQTKDGWHDPTRPDPTQATKIWPNPTLVKIILLLSPCILFCFWTISHLFLYFHGLVNSAKEVGLKIVINFFIFG